LVPTKTLFDIYTYECVYTIQRAGRENNGKDENKTITSVLRIYERMKITEHPA